MRFELVALDPLWPVGGRGYVAMTTHQADASGQRCARCGTLLAAPRYRYAPGGSVTLPFGDANASWATQAAPNCR
jgi:hypothetical protein